MSQNNILKSELLTPVKVTLSTSGIFVNTIKIRGYAKEEEGRGREERRGMRRGGEGEEEREGE